MEEKYVLEAMLETPIAIYDDTAGLAEFEKTHCMGASMQPSFTAQYLQRLIESLKPHTICQLKGPFEMTLVLVTLGEKFALIGPFCESEWDTKRAESTLAGLGISISYLIPYRLYRCQYSVLSMETVLRGVSILIEDAGLFDNSYRIETVDNLPRRVNISEVDDVDSYRRYYFDQVENRYRAEQRMIEMITAGDSKGAKAAYGEMTSLSSGVKFIDTPMWNNNLGPTILRTTIRIAAQQSGLSPILIDTIAQNHARKLYSEKFDYGRTDEYICALIDEMCSSIQKFHKQKHSALVRNIIVYIHLNLGQHMTVKTLADEFHFSAGHLSKQFKAETGTTVVNYIIDARTEKAAELLLSTNHQIQDISNYVGYLDNNYFVKVFKSKYHMTPTQYRKYALNPRTRPQTE